MKYLSLIVIGALLLMGCGSQSTSATPAQENAFRNPPKEPPAGAMEGLKKAMEKVPKSGGN